MIISRSSAILSFKSLVQSSYMLLSYHLYPNLRLFSRSPLLWRKLNWQSAFGVRLYVVYETHKDITTFVPHLNYNFIAQYSELKWERPRPNPFGECWLFCGINVAKREEETFSPRRYVGSDKTETESERWQLISTSYLSWPDGRLCWLVSEGRHWVEIKQYIYKVWKSCEGCLWQSRG